MTGSVGTRAVGWLARVAGRLGCALALLGLLAGIPAGLATFVGWPLPRHVPADPEAWQQILTSPLPDTAVVNLLAVALWIAWAAFAYSVAAEVRATRRGGIARRRRVISPLQAVAALLVAGLSAAPAAAVLATPPPPPAAVQPAAATAPAAVHHPAAPPAPLTGHGQSTSDVSTADGRADTADMAAIGSADELPRFALAAAESPLTVATGGQQYTVTVKKHDTLWDLAAAWLGDPHRWPEIYQLNRHRYDRHGYMRGGDHIEPGWVLRLPDDARPPAGTQPATPAAPATPPADPAPAPHAPAPSPPPDPTPSPAARSPSPPAATADPTSAPGPDSGDDGVVEPPAAPPAIPASTARPTDPTTASPTAQAPTADQPSRDLPGVELPGRGWVTVPVAAAVAAAVALMWIQRRRRYRPGQPAPARRTDPDLRPAPAAVAALHHARPEPATVDDPSEDEMDQPAPPQPADPAAVTPVTLGAQPHRLLHPADLPPLGVGLTGPGALDAARAILAAVLSAGGPWAADEQGTLATTDADLAALIGSGVDRYQLDRLTVAASLDDVLADLERHLLRRARQLADGSDLTPIAGPDPDQPLPPLVLLTAAPDGPAATRLAAILAVGSRLAITGILLGAWDTGATWQVNPDGTIDAHPGADAGTVRLNVLDPASTTAILDTLAEAHPVCDDLPPPPPRQPRRTSAPGIAARQSGTAMATTPPAATLADAAVSAPSLGRQGRHLRLRVLGHPAVDLIDSGPPENIRIRRSDGMQILAYLAAEPDGATSDQLITLLWPEVPHRESARSRFHTTISELRQTLAEVVGGEVIVRVGERYRVNPDHVQVDLWQLREVVDRAATTVDPDEHAAALRQVVTRYTGPLADGHSWLWLAPYHEAIRRHLLDTYIRLADLEPDTRAALSLIQDAIRLDPYNEDIYQHAMRLHATIGSPDGIRRTLRALTQRLTELEVGVSPQTQQLAAELLAKLDTRLRYSRTAA